MKFTNEEVLKIEEIGGECGIIRVRYEQSRTQNCPVGH